MNQILYSKKAEGRSNRKIIILILVLIVIIFFTVLFLIKQLDGKILANTYIGDIDIGMKTKEDAINLITPSVSNYEGKKIRLILNENYIDVTDKELGFGLENSANIMIEDAYKYGREGSFFENTGDIIQSYFKDMIIVPAYKFDDNKFLNVLITLSSGDEMIASDDTYEISGDKIYIYKGMDGIKIDEKLTKDYITTAFLNGVSEVNIPIVEGISKRVNLEKIYDEVYVAPQNAKIDKKDEFKVIKDILGKNFDLSEAQKAYDNLPDNEELIIQIKDLEADIKVSDLDSELFSNVLASYITTYDESDKDRVQNLKVAAERCNMILYPGDEFSYNKALGTRTIANGFAPGHSFAGGRVVTTIGGGICQVSSTLYNVVLMADLEVTNRVAHGMYVEYVEPSLDATVVDGAIDFKFKNDRKYPIKIESSAENGIVKVSILGIKDKNEPIIEIESVILETIKYKRIEEKDYTMEKGITKIVQEPVNGYRSEAYRIEKDSSGNVISRTLISKDRYIATNEIVKVGAKETVIIEVPVEPEIKEETSSVPDVIINSEEDYEEDEDSELPPGWNSPESPYSR